MRSSTYLLRAMASTVVGSNRNSKKLLFMKYFVMQKNQVLEFLTRAILLGIALAGAGACVPLSSYYYRPSAHEGVRLGSCGSPMETLLLHIGDGVSAKLTVVMGDNGSATMAIIFNVEPGSRVRMSAPYLQLTNVNNSTAENLEIAAIEGYIFSPDEPLHYIKTSISVNADMSAPAPKTSDRTNSWFEVKVNLLQPIPELFRVTLPLLEVNGKEMQPVDVTFEYAKYTGLVPLMC